eukprot:m.179272 g.179272  ORF g.179272 m.179272 type:complete len:118 (+) comp31966_c0_seq1:3077-3430(+)
MYLLESNSSSKNSDGISESHSSSTLTDLFRMTLFLLTAVTWEAVSSSASSSLPFFFESLDLKALAALMDPIIFRLNILMIGFLRALLLFQGWMIECVTSVELGFALLPPFGDFNKAT